MSLDDGWIEWKWSPEKTYPETLETEVEIRYKGEEDYKKGMRKPTKGYVRNYAWYHDGEDDDIIAYKLATPSEVA